MKKIVLSISVIVVFTVYAFYQKMFISESTFVDNSDTQAPVTTIVPTPSPSPTPTPIGMYKNGSYTGKAIDFLYGVMQVRATILGGKLSDVTFLKYPNDRPTSIEINGYAMPLLKSEAIKSQSAKVDIISGATDSVEAFNESLDSALAIAKN